jgi:hypothetical protein
VSTLLPLEELIAREHEGEYREDLATITGPRSDAEIARWVEALVARELGETVRGGLFAGKSVGAVFGLELASGERVVLKLFHPMMEASGLEAAQRCLELVVGRGFPAPSPRSPLFRADEAITGGFYAFADGDLRDGHDPSVRRELARSLAELAALLEDVDPEGLPLAPTRAEALWPPPHRSFVRLADDPSALWIDEIGQRARAVVRSTPLPLRPAHLDWGVKNARFRGERVCAVFDWDSLHAASEAEVVGRASAEFTAQWDFPARLTPTADESAAFVEEYQAARGRSFSLDELRVVSASGDYLVAQVARQAHAEGGSATPASFLALLHARAR